MNTAAIVLLVVLCAATVIYAWKWIAAERSLGRLQLTRIGPLRLATGFVANFFDTLGIGSFAPTTAVFKLRRLVPDEFIPATLNVGHTLPTIAQALIFIAAVKVGSLTLVAMIAAAVIGAWLGAGFIARTSRRAIQLIMGFALVIASTLLILVNTGLLPGGGDALELNGARLAIAVVANFALGALMTAGIGLYAPCLILVSLLGMDPLAAFPIMMGSCAFLMPVAGLRFIRSGRYDARAALGLALGGVPAVLIAAFIVKSLPLEWLRWLVVAVVLYTAAAMLRSGLTRETPAPVASVEQP